RPERALRLHRRRRRELDAGLGRAAERRHRSREPRRRAVSGDAGGAESGLPERGLLLLPGGRHRRVRALRQRGAPVRPRRAGGQPWTDDHDIGASVGVVHAVFPEAVAGDSGRAACGFLGTDKSGDFQSPSFPGRWYLFIATTYDGGKTWTTVNATPNDPVQGAGGICLQGIACSGNNRNLLDFNEVTIDDHGRVLFGYDDGCVSDACLSSGGATND